MQRQFNLPGARDKTLFTPGPLTTSLSVKQAMLHDAGSWHHEFNALVCRLRRAVLELAGVADGGYELIFMQGSGTFGVESVFSTVIPRDGKLCILANGAYGERMVQMAICLGIATVVLRTPEDRTPGVEELQKVLTEDAAITHVAMVHCETTTGILNPIELLGPIVNQAGRRFIVDAMSSFGAVPIDFAGAGIDFLISSPNKCLESVPGFSFVVGRRDRLLECEGRARSLSLDLLSQWKNFEKNGQFRYTPPTHAILAFAQALKELEMEGGPAARRARYARNHQVLVQGMTDLGFEVYLPAEVQSYIITAFHFPSDSGFEFPTFYDRLSDKGFIIYPGKIGQADTFRIGSIGRIFEADIRALLGAIGESLKEMNLE